MKSLKSIGNLLLGIVISVGIVVATVLLFALGAKLAFTIQPFINWLAGILFLINVLVLLIAIAPKARSWAGLIIYTTSFVYGLGAWIFGLAVTLAFWGWIAVIIGLLMGGVGVVPIGMLASVFNGRWDNFCTLLISLVLTYGARMIGAWLVSSSENQSNNAEKYDDEIIDVEPVKHNRTWRDIE